MTTYTVDFQNDLPATLTMVVYQTLPAPADLESVVWKLTTCAPNASSSVTWDTTYNVCLVDYSQDGEKGVYTASQILRTDLGTNWNIVIQNGIQRLVQDLGSGTTLPDGIIITNISGESANPGIGISDEGSVYKKDVQDGTSAQFRITPTYWVGLFTAEVKQGDILSDRSMVGPFELQFASANRALIHVYNIDEDTKVDITYPQNGKTQSIFLLGPHITRGSVTKGHLTHLIRRPVTKGHWTPLGLLNNTLSITLLDPQQATTYDIRQDAGNPPEQTRTLKPRATDPVPVQGNVTIHNHGPSILQVVIN